MSLLLLLAGCLTDSGPCTAYCNYVCDCHGDDPAYSCDDCYTVYGGGDAELQDECETALADLRQADQDAGLTCDDTTDTGA